MRSRTAFVAGLVGVSLLAGCNNDSKTDSNNDTSSFEQTIAQQAGEIQSLKDGQSKLEAAAGSLGTTLTQGVADLERAQTVITEMQAKLAAKPDGDPEAIKALQATLTQLQNDLAAKPAGDPKAVKALQDTLAEVQAKLAAKLDGDPVAVKALQDTITEVQAKLAAKPDGDPVAVKALQNALAEVQAKLAAKPDGDPVAIKALQDALAQVQKDLLAKPSGDPEAIKALQATLAQLQKDLAAKPAGDPATLKNILARLAEIEMTLRRPDQSDMALTQFVDPMIGTGQVPPTDTGSKEDLLGGFTTPSANAPFGMIAWGPDTPGVPGTWSPPGYHYPQASITGFSMTHLSGVGCPSGGAIPIMPQIDAKEGTIPFSHNDEVARAGYYSVKMSNAIRTELTSTVRSGLGRFTYPEGKPALLKIKASTNYTGSSSSIAASEADRTVSGYATGGAFCGSGSSYKIYFYATLDQAFTAAQSGNSITLTFAAPPPSAPVKALMKVGISYVSVANAKANLEAEGGPLTFEQAREQADAAWNKRLNAIQVTGGTRDEKTKFYSAMYHAFLAPSVFSDVNGEYISFNDAGTTKKAPEGHVQYTTFSSWDTYRSLAPLQALLAPDEVGDMMQSLVFDAEDCGGTFPMWAEGNTSSNIMPGDGASIIVAQSNAFGASGFDRQKARKIMLDTAFGRATECRTTTNLPGLKGYMERGYLAGGDGEGQPTSTNMEYASSDFAVSRYASGVAATDPQIVAGAEADEPKTLLSRSGNWANLFNPNWRNVVGQPYPQLQPRNKDGTWRSYLPVSSWDNDYREGNAEQYTFMVPHDIRGMLAKLVIDTDKDKGTEKDGIARLDEFTKNLNGGWSYQPARLWIGNEPGFLTPWLYNWTSQPYKTQALVRRIVDEQFAVSPSGLPGNDDEGAMSGVYIWGALGLYPEIPAVSGFALHSPLFSEARIKLGNGKVLTIAADKTPLKYIQKLTVNGAAHDSPWIDLDKLSSGARLEFTLSDKPSCWGSNPPAALLPPSFAPDGTQTPRLKPEKECALN
ncbi:glycoside hydrolase family 92 protein [Phyllobacterium sp. SYP-B3895]|uniref:GH92 family glycosyl hydrolase n=1 Tax=Phyllobacterium sp. SYP-B3895 TaxID=2663240 RepID=UPI001299C341|nr:GH92 family glycosyl hydrolase [Phyllobacterium sp. SYP-B3895]MRG54295.1 glycoside hydrolase family 92 protein [Phyllobacterium sp. SYP-B3895]